jgi:RNA polymerase sigma-B factor
MAGPATPAELCRQLGVSCQQWGSLQQQRQLRRSCSLAPDQLELVAAPCADPPEDEAGGASEVEAMLAILEPRQRLVVRQVVLAGWSYRRLGKQMQVSPMTVQRLLRGGLDRLRRHLTQLEVTPGARADREPSAAPAC